jgi:hypothetical protein
MWEYLGPHHKQTRGISEQERIALKKRFADTLSAVAAKHRALDFISMGV